MAARRVTIEAVVGHVDVIFGGGSSLKVNNAHGSSMQFKHI
jgi:hypothetical protein